MTSEDYVELVTRPVESMEFLFRDLNEANPCKQFQCILMDLQSIKDWVEDYRKNGPAKPFVEISELDSKVDEPIPEGWDEPISFAPEPEEQTPPTFI